MPLPKLERLSACTGFAAVALWVAGAVVSWGVTSNIADDASDTRVLAWIHANAGTLIAGGWLWIVGCLLFVWFLGTLRARLVVSEGGAGTFSAIAFAGGVATAVFGILIPAGDVAAAIDRSSLSPASAGALHHLSDVFFGGAELAAALLLAAVAVLGLATRVVPRWFAVASAVVAVVLLILPIGWAALLFGVPLWTLTATALLVRPHSVRGTALAARAA